MNEKLDVIIIGCGPIGMKCGIQAERRNINYLIIEKGCIVNSVYNYPTNMTFFSTSERLEIGGVPFVSHSDKPTRREALEYYRRVKQAWNLNVNTFEKVLKVAGKKGAFIIETNKDSYKCKNLIISTGFYDTPNLLNIPGENLPKVFHYFTEAHPFSYSKVLVIGAGNSAIDVALETFRRGAEVTLIVREYKIKDSVKYWVKPDIENRIKEGSIKVYFNSEVSEIRDNEVDIKTPNGSKTLENDFVLAMTGYQPNFSFLKKIGINISEDDSLIPSFNEKTFETNIQGVYLAGVVCGGMNTGKYFIENSINHAINIFNNIESNNN